jgi:hypothetical protein
MARKCSTASRSRSASVSLEVDVHTRIDDLVHRLEQELVRDQQVYMVHGSYWNSDSIL